MPHALPLLASRLFNTPLLVLPETAELLAENLSARLAGLGPAPKAQQMFDDPEGDPFDEPYRVQNGTALIPIRGELVNRGSWLSSASGLTSYDEIQSALRQSAADPRVERIALDIDSPGGEAAGAMETADEVRGLARMKPVIAYVNSLAASAAYAIASGAKEIVISPSGAVGSIGVVWLHIDKSKMLADEGLKPTMLYAGLYKVDGNQFAALDDGARTRIQAQIDDVYGLFTDTVGKMRPKFTAEGARKTEAGMFMGRKAVEAGLADRVGLFPSANSMRPNRSMMTMTLEKPEKKEAAMADTSALVAAKNEGVNEGVAAERARIKSILECEAAKGKGGLARQMALSTSMSAEEAAALLASAAPEVAPGSRMGAVPTPAIRPDPVQREPNPQGDADANWGAIAADYNKRAGVKAR